MRLLYSIRSWMSSSNGLEFSVWCCYGFRIMYLSLAEQGARCIFQFIMDGLQRRLQLVLHQDEKSV